MKLGLIDVLFEAGHKVYAGPLRDIQYWIDAWGEVTITATKDGTPVQKVVSLRSINDTYESKSEMIRVVGETIRELECYPTVWSSYIGG